RAERVELGLDAGGREAAQVVVGHGGSLQDSGRQSMNWATERGLRAEEAPPSAVAREIDAPPPGPGRAGLHSRDRRGRGRCPATANWSPFSSSTKSNSPATAKPSPLTARAIRGHHRRMDGDDEDDELFTVPLPPPPPGADKDVVFFRRRALEDREDEDVMLRRVPRETDARFRAAAGGRGMTHAQYLVALVALHEAMRARADAGDAALGEELRRLGLASVTV